MEPRDSATLPLLGLALLRRLGKSRKKKRSSAETTPDRPASLSSFSGIAVVISLVKTSAFLVLLLVYLVVEMLAAMLAYAYLNIYQIDTFGYLIKLSRNILTTMLVFFETYAPPDLANRAYATLLGEIGPKSLMLLVLGLAVSTLIRLLVWVIHRGFEGVRSGKPAATVKA
jgi:hypothetical protein